MHEFSSHAILLSRGLKKLDTVLKSLGNFEMEKLELSAQDLMKMLNWKKSKAYYWINSGKFETVERADGIKALLTREDIERYKTAENSEQFEIVSSECEIVQDSSTNSANVSFENSANVSKSLQNSEIKVLGEAIDALRFALEHSGQQTKLLTDSSRMTEEKYFELNGNYQTLKIKHDDLLKKFETLELENSALKKQIEELKSSWAYKLFH